MRFTSVIYVGIISSATSPVGSENPIIDSSNSRHPGFIPQPVVPRPPIPGWVPGVPAGVPGIPAGVPGIPAGVPGIPAGVPGIPAGVPGYPGGWRPGYNSFQQAQDLEAAKYKAEVGVPAEAKVSSSWLPNVGSQGVVKWAAGLLGVDGWMGGRKISLLGEDGDDVSPPGMDDLPIPSLPPVPTGLPGSVTPSGPGSMNPSGPTPSIGPSSPVGGEGEESTKPKTCKSGLTTCRDCLEVSGCYWCSVFVKEESSTTSISPSESSTVSKMRRNLLSIPTGTCSNRDVSDQSTNLTCVKTCSGTSSNLKLVQLGSLVAITVLIMKV